MTENSESLSELTIRIRDKNFVEVERDDRPTAFADGKVTAFARRADVWSDWEVAYFDTVAKAWRQDVVRVHATMPEVLQRKVILAILKELG